MHQVVLVLGDLRFFRLLNPFDQAAAAALGERCKRRAGLLDKARRGKLAVPHGQFLKALDPPEDAIAADRPEIEGGKAKRGAPDLGIGDVEAPEHQVRLAIPQFADLDRVPVVHQEHEDIAVAGKKRGRVRGDRMVRVVGVGAPIKDARNLPAFVPGPVARDLLDRLDHLRVKNPTVFRPGRRHEAAVHLVEFGRLASPVHPHPIGQSVGGDLRRQGPKIARRGLGELGKLPERPVRRGDLAAVLHPDPERVGVGDGADILGGKKFDLAGIDHRLDRVFAAAFNACAQVSEAEEFLVSRTRDPLLCNVHPGLACGKVANGVSVHLVSPCHATRGPAPRN